MGNENKAASKSNGNEEIQTLQSQTISNKPSFQRKLANYKLSLSTIKKPQKNQKQTTYKLNNSEKLNLKDRRLARPLPSSLGQIQKIIYQDNTNQSELRKQITTIDKSSYRGIQGYLLMQNDFQDISSGSGSMIKFDNGVYCVLTAAHNLLQIVPGRNNQYLEIPNTKIKYFFSCIKDIYFCELEAQSFDVVPQYKSEPGTLEGFDIGLVWFKQSDLLILEEESAPKPKNIRWGVPIEDLHISSGEKIIVIGYPYEYHGCLYEMEGNIQKIETLQNGQVIIFYVNINTTEGQSGSPVYLVRDQQYYLIGVHSGYDDFEYANVATGINQYLTEWIVKMFSLKCENLSESLEIKIKIWQILF